MFRAAKQESIGSWAITNSIARPANERVAWIAAAAVGILVLIAAGWVSAGDLPQLPDSAASIIEHYRNTSIDELAAASDVSLAPAEIEIGRIKQRVGRVAAHVNLAAYFSSGLSWVPMLDREIVAWAARLTAVDTAIEAGLSLMAGSRQLTDVYRVAADAFLRPREATIHSRLRDQIQALELVFADAIQELAPDRASRLPVPLTAGRWANHFEAVEEAEEQLLTALRVGLRASRLLSHLIDVGQLVEPVYSQFLGDGDQPTLSNHDLKGTLVEVDSRLQSALAESDELSKMVAGIREINIGMQRLELLEKLLRVLFLINRATMTGIAAVEPALEDGQGSIGLLGYDRKLLDALDSIVAHIDEVEQAIETLEKARRLISELELVGDEALPIVGTRVISNAVETISGGLKFLRDLAPLGSRVLGSGTTRSYLILAQSADELRATGGFVSGLWTVTFQSGTLADVLYHDTVRVDDWTLLELYPGAPPGLEEHMDAKVWLMRDVSWEPDFPSTARMAKDMFWLGQHEEVDGVIALNQWSLLGIVESLGSVPSPEGGVITPRNLLPILERGTDDHGRAYLDLVLQGTIEHLKQPVPLSTLMRISSALRKSLIARDVLVYMDDPEIQAIATRNGWDGKIRNGRADYLYIVDSNVGWSKSDRNIERAVSYTLDFRETGSPRASLSIRYQNHSGPGSPGCEPQWRSRGSNYNQLKNACYWNYWRVYVPQSARLLSHTPLPLPEYSVSVETGRGLPGEDTTRVGSSYNKTVLSGLFPLEAGEGKEVNLVYDLPSELLRRDDDGVTYELLIQKQPGVLKRELQIELLFESDLRMVSSSIEPVTYTDSSVTFSLILTQDTTLSASFKRSESGDQ